MTRGGLLEDKVKLADILTCHMVAGKVMGKDVIATSFRWFGR
jgi:uncharacterized surface protein with fasciclin (FAS1) repeats